MRAAYPLLAVFLGLIGSAAIEIGGTLTGVITAMTRLLALDAVAYAVGTLLLALAFAPLFRRARGIAAVGAGLLFLVLYAPVVGAVAAALELTATGAWGTPSVVRGAFITIPGNLIVTYLLDLWFVAVPLGVVGVMLLWRQARAAATPARLRPAA